MMKRSILFFLMLLWGEHLSAWGFFAHRLINRQAVFSLPFEMVGFYKQQIDYLEDNAVNPDRRRYAVEGEAERHYIDLDHYGESVLTEMPRQWEVACDKYSIDTLKAHGIVPWHIHLMKYRLTRAFKEHDYLSVIRLSADIGHYIADANVPLHTTKNYNGQLTDQHGIHGLWETRIPELFSSDYDLLIGKATYLPEPAQTAWEAVINAHLCVDSVLTFEKRLSNSFPLDKKYSYEERGASFVKVYSRAYTEKYHYLLDGMVERRLRASIQMVADFWFTCWVDAGQPPLISPVASEIDSMRSRMIFFFMGRKMRKREHEH